MSGVAVYKWENTTPEMLSNSLKASYILQITRRVWTYAVLSAKQVQDKEGAGVRPCEM